MAKQFRWKTAGIVLLLAAGTFMSGPAKADQSLTTWGNGKSEETGISRSDCTYPVSSGENVSDLPSVETDGVNREQVISWIEKQGARSEYYLEGLSFTEVQLDEDEPLEIIAGIDGGVHLGQFFVFDQDPSGDYKLAMERDWKVEQLNPGQEKDLELIKVFETVERTGGSGIDVQIAHLWYLDNGKVKEVWEGYLKVRNSMFAGEHSLLAGSYQVIDDILYSWETSSKMADDDVTLLEDPVTIFTVYKFDGTKFVPQ